MTHIPKMIPISDLRQHVVEVLRQVSESREPLAITQRGRAAAVMLSVREYECGEDERRLLKALAMGAKEIEAGEGVDLDAVMEEADAIVPPTRQKRR